MGKHYFISDVHLGSALIENTAEHEEKFISWLSIISQDASTIYLLGDIFDFWFEFPYKKIQTEYNRTLDKIKDICEKGIDVHFFCGNHDQWTFGHLEKYCGMSVHRKSEIINIEGKQFFFAHGHGLGIQTKRVKLLNAIFECKAIQNIFRYTVPAQWAWNFGKKWSSQNRKKHDATPAKFAGEAKEQQVIFAKEHSTLNPNIDFYIMGHRHIDLNLKLMTGAQLIILGDFYHLFTYATFDGSSISIEDYIV